MAHRNPGAQEPVAANIRSAASDEGGAVSALDQAKPVVDVVVPVLSLLAVPLVPIIGYQFKRSQEARKAREAERADRAAAPTLTAGVALPLLIRDARLTTAADTDGQPQFTIALTFSPGTPAYLSAPGSPGPDGPVSTRSNEAPEPPTTAAGPVLPPDLTIAELRCDGAGGTPATTMLDRQLVSRVAGGDDAGFYRARSDYRTTDDDRRTPVEAYQWSNVAGAAAARALWMLLLPFTLTNLSMWMEPPSGGVVRIGLRGLSRLLSLTTTLTLVTAFGVIALDLTAWQCGAPSTACRNRLPLVDAVFSGFFEPAGRRLALAALVPIGLVVLLWVLGRRTWARYESYPLTTRHADGDGLASPLFWDGREQVGRLRSLHVAAGLALIDMFLLNLLVRHDSDPTAFLGVDLSVAPSVAVLAGGVLRALSLLVLGLSGLLLILPSVTARASRSWGAARTTTFVRSIAVVLTALTLGYACIPRRPWETAGPMPGPADAAAILLAVQVGLVAVYVVAVAVLRRQSPRALFGGFGAPIAASAGVAMATVLGGGLAIQVGTVLSGNGPDLRVEGGWVPFQPAAAYQWAMLGLVATAAVAAVRRVWGRTLTRSLLMRSTRAVTDLDFPDGRDGDRERAAQIDRAIAEARLPERTAAFYGRLWWVLAPAAAVATGLALDAATPPDLFPDGSLVDGLVYFGGYLAAVLVIVLLLYGVQAYRFAGARRTIGTLWDMGTFWPRSCHPLAPPCYAERIVPDLLRRGSWLARGQNRLVLSGDSQGSVYAAATLLQMPAADRAGAALLTTGSPLGRFYSRLFPAYVDEATLSTVRDAVAGRWINLWRDTDRGGGPVEPTTSSPDDGADRRLLDPSSFDSVPGDTLPPPLFGHFLYRQDPAYGQALEQLRGRLA
jgi:hypothetical protein